MLSLRGVLRHYGNPAEAPALRGVSLDLQQGEFVAIEGPSGAGKSTLVNILGLLDRPDAGDYLVKGRSTSGLSAVEAARLRSDTFGFVFQSFHLLDDRPAIQSIELGLAYRKVDAATRRYRAQEALERLGMSSLAEKPANLLSGGERQRVAIARALATGAPVLLADEPTGNLDSSNSRHLVDTLTDLHRQGTTIVLVTHSDSVASAAMRRVTLRDGQVQSDSGASGASAPVIISELPPGVASRVSTGTVVADAWNTLATRPRKAWAMAGAVAIGIALAAGTLGVSVTARAQVSDAFDARVNRDVTVQWTSEDDGPFDSQGLEQALTTIESLNGVAAVGIASDYGGVPVQVSTTRAPETAYVFSVAGDFFEAARIDLESPRTGAFMLNHGEAVVGANLAQQLGLGPVDAGPTVTFGGDTYTVVGIVRASPRVPELLGAVTVGAASLDSGSAQSHAAIVLTDVGAAQQVAREAPLAVNPYQPTRLYVVAPVDPRELRDEIESSVATTLGVVTLVALVGGLAGLANAMLLSVGERTREFGLRRAVGARSVHVAALVTLESVIVGLLGALVGLAGGLSAVVVVSLVNGWQPVFDIRLAPLAVAAGATMGVLGGLFAARRAMRIEPHAALRT